uniref:KATNIP domain-containing protein n=1 Tax=Phytophthora ramorum TaxID=164328 RepID=H3G7B6_PHYRM
IPVLPSGKWLQIEILSTWGDPYYVGLNGVEIFDHRGELVRFQDPATQVTACPESINVLEENTDDPRVPTNLIDGVNFTCDDFHMWLAPFTPEQAHYVLLELGATIAVSMVRIWNYNKSRTHTCRGVREARLILYDAYPAALTGISSGRAESGNTIFEGEIRQAPGLVGADSMDISNEVILFTQDATILEAIEANDEALTAISREQQREDEEAREIVASVHRSMELRRPQTSDGGSRSKSPVAVKVADGAKTLEENFNDEANMEEKLPYGRRLTLQLHNTWGDRNYIGLTQVEVLVGSRGTSIPLDAANIDATPRDLASLGYVGDPRTLDKLIDGEATTCDDTHMWLVPMEAASVPEVRIEFKKGQYFFGLRIWNYNKSSEDSFRGVKQLTVALDGVVISPKETGFLLRKAPGAANFDFGQLLRFPDIVEKRVTYPFSTRAYKTPIIRQDYEAQLYPQGFLLKIVCWQTWGDPYYLGLNGLELYDFAGARIDHKPAIVSAVPYSVSELDHTNGRQQDTRTPDNLMSGLDKNTWEAHDAWLAPLASSLGNQQGNIVYIGFDTPVVLSMIKFWNYSKTPERGVKDLDIYLDDMHLFSGTLRKAPAGDDHGANSRYSKMHKVTEHFGQPVLFSASQAQVDAEKRNVSYCGTEEQDVLGINEGQVMQESRAMYRKPDP